MLECQLQVNAHLVLCTATQENEAPGSSVRDSQGYQRDICRFLNRDTDLNQTLLDANGALSQMTYGEVLNLSLKDSSSLIKAVIRFYYEYLLSALQFSPQTSDLIQQLIHIKDRVQYLEKGYVQTHICQIPIFLSFTMNYLFLQVDLHKKDFK